MSLIPGMHISTSVANIWPALSSSPTHPAASLRQPRSSIPRTMAPSLLLCALPPPSPSPSRSPSPPCFLLPLSASQLLILSTSRRALPCLAPFPNLCGTCTGVRRGNKCIATRSVDPAADSLQPEDEDEDEDVQLVISRLEQYTERVPNEVLRVHAMVDGEEDQVIIFKGFSSSLMRATAFDPAEPVLPVSATIQAIDRIRGPYNPAKVLLIKGGRRLSWQQFRMLLREKGL